MPNGKIIKPIKARRMVSGASVQTPNVTGGIGVTRQLASGIANIATRYQNIKLNNEKTLGESLVASSQAEVSGFISKMKYDESYYKNEDKLSILNKKLDEMGKAYQKSSLDNGFSKDVENAYMDKLQVIKSRLKDSFIQKNMAYNEGVEKQNFDMVQVLRARNQQSEMIEGNYKESILDFKGSIGDMDGAIKKGYISPGKAIEEIDKQKRKLIEARVLSINEESDLSTFEKMTFEEFKEEFKDFEYEIGGNKLELTADDFKNYKKGIKTSLADIGRQKKAGQQISKVKEQEYQANLRKNPVKAATDELMLPAGIPYSRSLLELGTKATNNALGTNYKNLNEVIDDGFLPITIQEGFNSKSDIYNNSDLDGETIMKTRGEEYQEYVAGYDKLEEPVMNGQYNSGEVDVPIGYRATRSYFAYGDFKNVFDATYVPANRKILDQFKDVKIDSVSNLSLYETKTRTEGLLASEYKTGALSPLQLSKIKEPQKGQYTETGLGSMITGLKIAAMQGDENAARLAKDMEMLLNDNMKLMVMEETGGILTDDLADDLKLDKYVGQPLSALNKKDIGRVINSFSSDDDFQNRFKEKMAPALKEMTKGIQTIDVGNGKFINISDRYNPGKVAKTINAMVQNETFRTAEGLIPPGKDINFSSFLGEDKIIPMYEGKPLYINKKRAFIDLGGNDE